jgi:hypothetical protein
MVRVTLEALVLHTIVYPQTSSSYGFSAVLLG